MLHIRLVILLTRVFSVIGSFLRLFSTALNQFTRP